MRTTDFPNVAFWLFTIFFSCHCRSETETFLDLSYSYSDKTVFYPGQKSFVLSKDYDGVVNNGVWYSSYSFCMGEHGGTHLDAPFHFSPDGWTVDKIPTSNLINVPATLIDVEKDVNNAEDPSSFTLQVEHLMRHEKFNGIIPSRSVVLIYTGWSKYWPDKYRYLGLKNSSNPRENETTTTLHFPGVSVEAAAWLANERQIVGIGLDTASVDPGNTVTYPTHVLLAKEQVYNLENVANLHALKNYRNCYLRLFVLPLKIVGGTGAAARILAHCA